MYRIEKNLLELLKYDLPSDNINKLDPTKISNFINENCVITPNKTLFVKTNIRQGILPVILKELLLTRIMIKIHAKNMTQIL